MKKIFKKMTASLMSGLMLLGSTCAIAGSASAANNEVQPRGTWYVYGDVNNDGEINVIDIIAVTKAINKFEELTGDSRLPLNYAVSRPEIYGLLIPQAADIDGNGYIDNSDKELIKYYCLGLDDEAGRCGQSFYIN